MKIINNLSQYNYPYIQSLPPSSLSLEGNDFWKFRTVQSFCDLISVEDKRLYSRLVALGTIGIGATIASLAAMGTVTLPTSLIVVPCALVACGAIGYSLHLHDYENLEELEQLRLEASKMSLEQIAQTYGWTFLLQKGILLPDVFLHKYRQQLQGKNLVEIINYYEKVFAHISQTSHLRFKYLIPPPREWRQQWREETRSKTFEEIIQFYSLEKLEKYTILEVGEYLRLKELKQDYDAIQRHREQQSKSIEQEFQARITPFKQAYDAACERAHQWYRNHEAVRELQNFEIRYMRERQAVQDRLNLRKNQAKAQLNQAIASLTHQGQIPYECLVPSEKIIYDQYHRQLNGAISQAEREAREQIERINLRYIQECTYLNAEESRLRIERQRLIDEAKSQYDRDIAPHRIDKENRLGPVEAQFHSSVHDLNHRYQSYLRIIHAIHS